MAIILVFTICITLAHSKMYDKIKLLDNINIKYIKNDDIYDVIQHSTNKLFNKLGLICYTSIIVNAIFFICSTIWAIGYVNYISISKYAILAEYIIIIINMYSLAWIIYNMRTVNKYINWIKDKISKETGKTLDEIK